MPSRPPKPADSPWITPYLAVSDVRRSIEFYERAFGFDLQRTVAGPDDAPIHATLRYREGMIMLGVEDRSKDLPREGLGRSPESLGGAGLVLYAYAEDVDALYARAVEAGVQVGFPPEEMWWGDRVCLLFDPDGHAWNFATNESDLPRQRPGSG
jgi:uncharacterized glyoxalase superfamily protein PhnB